MRIPGHCSFDDTTTVLAHLNGGGMGAKHLNIHGAYCCNKCHDIVDSRVMTTLGKTNIEVYFLEGVIRTQVIMIQDGILKL